MMVMNKIKAGVYQRIEKKPADPTVECENCGLHWNSKLFNFCTRCGKELGGGGG